MSQKEREEMKREKVKDTEMRVGVVVNNKTNRYEAVLVRDGVR